MLRTAWTVCYGALVAALAVAYLTHTPWLILPLFLLALTSSTLWLWLTHRPDAPPRFPPLTRRLRALALALIPLVFLAGVVAALLQHAHP